MSKIHLWPDEIRDHNGLTTAGFTLEDTRGARHSLWYRLPTEHKGALTQNCDPFMVAAIFTAMHSPADLVVHGEVSPSLLGNLDEFQTIWSCWLPEKYTKVDIIPDSERELSKLGTSSAVAAFSGGIDSSYSVWRYRSGPSGRFRYNLRAGLVLHGFDIQLRHGKTFERAFSKAKIMLDSLGMEPIAMANNLKSLGHYSDGHGAILASCLMLLQGKYEVGLIASSSTYELMTRAGALPYGSNILTDELLSSESFTIINDSSGISRLNKIRELTNWPEAMQHLRVCLGRDATQRDHNCCQCLKCIRNIMAFRVQGLGLPPCFEKDISNSQLLRLNYPISYRISYFESIVQLAEEAGTSDSWVRALKISLFLNQLKLWTKRILFRKRLARH